MQKQLQWFKFLTNLIIFKINLKLIWMAVFDKHKPKEIHQLHQ